LKKSIAAAVAAVVVGVSAAVSGVFTGDVQDYQCPDASYTRTEAKAIDVGGAHGPVDAIICENGEFTITARRAGDSKFEVAIYDERNRIFIDTLP